MKSLTISIIIVSMITASFHVLTKQYYDALLTLFIASVITCLIQTGFKYISRFKNEGSK
ncbi:TPA: hypothetical protein ACPTLY_004686 [Escherichia coli]